MTVEVAQLVSQLCGRFGRQIDDSTMQSFSDALEGVDLGVVDDLVTLLVRECEYFPRPAEVLKHVRSSNEVFKLVESKLPEHWRLETYGCANCNDTGHVTIWHPKTMQAAIHYRNNFIDEQTYNRRKYTMGAPCTCFRGDAFTDINTIKNGRIVKLRDVVRYCSERMVRPDMASPKDDIALLKWADEWLENYRNLGAQESTKRNPRYVQQFEDF